MKLNNSGYAAVNGKGTYQSTFELNIDIYHISLFHPF